MSRRNGQFTSAPFKRVIFFHSRLGRYKLLSFSSCVPLVAPRIFVFTAAECADCTLICLARCEVTCFWEAQGDQLIAVSGYIYERETKYQETWVKSGERRIRMPVRGEVHLLKSPPSPQSQLLDSLSSAFLRTIARWCTCLVLQGPS